MKARFTTLCILALLAPQGIAQMLPYNPTTILTPDSSASNGDLAYIFQPQASSSKHEFLSLNISSNISASNPQFTLLSSRLPFDIDSSISYIPAITPHGDISVVSGSCTSNSSALWRLVPDGKSVAGNGTWREATVNVGTSAVSRSANFLSQSFAFSTFVQANSSQASIYVFGGMCPDDGTQTAATWQSAATYSNTMSRFTPTSDKQYNLGVPINRGLPIAEAGFTLTGLSPTYSNGSGPVTQQQNYVLLGGHTQTAFLNTSQIAIWSLPEESWTFITISSTSISDSNTELAIRSTSPTIDSRSGHTAVLTEDGTSLIVYGGWVGDVGQAADPQLAILRLGSGFGGDGNWQWVVPQAQPTGPSVYGHGAAILPGNVMMILGGEEISATTSKRQAANPVKFWNATSMTWIDEYVNPAYIAALARQESKQRSHASSSLNRKLGIGLGVGLGVALLLAAILLFCWCVRKQRRKRDQREDDLHALGMSQGVVYTPQAMQEREGGGFPWSNGRWNDTSRQTPRAEYESSDSTAHYENLNNGVHHLGNSTEYPSPPKQITRKPLHSRNARGAYQAAPAFDFAAVNAHGRTNSLGTAGPIHPIYEADEEDQTRNSAEHVKSTLVTETLDNKRHSDPFRDPQPQQNLQLPFRSGSLTDTERSNRSREKEREREIQEWVSDWAAAESLMNAQKRSHSNAGRISPTKRAQLIAASTISSMSGEEDSGRTASNLSEQSVAISSMSISRSGSSSQGRSRSNSLRGFIANAMSPFSAAGPSSTAPSTVMVTTVHEVQHQLPKSAGSGSSSFTTAQTSFHALQVEGDTQLAPPEDYSGSGQSSPARSYESPGSPSKLKAGGLNRSKNNVGWLGSIKRAIVGPQHDDVDFQSIPSRDTSPIRVDQFRGSAPRRTVSEGGTLWRRKQGKGDWEDSATGTLHERRSRNTFGYDIHEPGHGNSGASGAVTDDEDDWDIEQAVQNRVVQVMFTVPKEKLRVVNHDFKDDVSMSDIASLRSKQGSGKSDHVETALRLPPPRATEGQTVLKTLPESPSHDLDVAQSSSQKVTDSPRKWKGKEREVDLVRELEKEVQREIEAEKLEKQSSTTLLTPTKALRKPKSRVLDMVEVLEKRSSPERS